MIILAIIEISIVPIGTEEPSVSKYVTKALDVLEEKNVEYEITSMGTIIEGDLDKIMEIAKEMHKNTFDNDIARVVTTIKIDDRKDKTQKMKQKKKSVL